MFYSETITTTGGVDDTGRLFDAAVHLAAHMAPQTADGAAAKHALRRLAALAGVEEIRFELHPKKGLQCFITRKPEPRVPPVEVTEPGVKPAEDIAPAADGIY